MLTTWKQADVFPIIARIISEAPKDQDGFVTHDEITKALLSDSEAARIIEEAQKQQEEQRSLDWLAHNMVAWFSERITVGQSDWKDQFERIKKDGKWAYKPAT